VSAGVVTLAFGEGWRGTGARGLWLADDRVPGIWHRLQRGAGGPGPTRAL